MSAKRFCLSVIKSAVIALAGALSGILIFSVIVKVATLPVAAVRAVNQFIKAVSLFCGCFFSLKESKGMVKGALAGMLFTLLVYSVFLAIDSSAFTAKSFWLDETFDLIVGAVSGAVAVNVRGEG